MGESSRRFGGVAGSSHSYSMGMIMVDYLGKFQSVRMEIDEFVVQSKFNSKLREHTVTLGQMTKELDSTRAAEKALRTKLRDMELDNDDLEKSERFVVLLMCSKGDVTYAGVT